MSIVDASGPSCYVFMTMGYIGEVQNAGGEVPLDLSRVAVVHVSGDGINVCGHVLLHVHSGYYFHVAGLRDYPRYMDERGYRRYLRENQKREIRRRVLSLPRPQDAALHLEALMAARWTWLVVPNNCVAFVEEVIEAGGGTWSSVTNCPALGLNPSLSEQWRDLGLRYEQLERDIIRNALERQGIGF